MESSAPTLVYEEGNLVKRVIRDLYDKDIEEVLVEGEPAYKEAKAFMRMLMPSHAKKVQNYKDHTPLFLRHQVESQLEAIHVPTAQLKSGGYIVINPTEALVSIDVNSGKATKERNIEQTALRTNLEAAEEAARQMRLRDLAGLLVIDFIDMDENKNVRAVEKKMKDALKRDRARIQVGRISQFGLMEMSRQRRRTSLVEGSADICPHCQGTGHIRSIESSALVALRTLEEEGVRGRAAHVRLSCPTEVALYLLNEKRDHLNAIEGRYEMRVTVNADDTLMRPNCQLERIETRREAARAEAAAQVEAPLVTAGETARDADDKPSDEPSIEDAASEDGGGRKRRRRGRRGGRNRRRREDGAPDDSAEALAAPPAYTESEAESADADADVLPVVTPTGGDAFDSTDAETEKPKRKRSSRRRKKSDDTDAKAETDASAAVEGEAEGDSPADDDAAVEDKPKPRRRRRKKTEAAEETTAESASEPAAESEPAADDAAEEKPKPKRRVRRKKAEAKPEVEESAAETAAAEPAPSPEPAKASDSAQPQGEPAKVGATDSPDDAETDEKGEEKPRRKGWWQRSSKLLGLN